MNALASSVALLLSQATSLPTAEHVDQMSQVGSGRIVGGWGYVWTCYAIAWTGMALYAASLWYRLRRFRKGSSP